MGCCGTKSVAANMPVLVHRHLDARLLEDYSSKVLLGAQLERHLAKDSDNIMIRVTPEGDALVWDPRAIRHDSERVLLTQIKEVRPGQNTATFRKNPDMASAPRSFSVIYDSKTLDVVCANDDQYKSFFYGLQYLIEKAYDKLLEDEASRRTARELKRKAAEREPEEPKKKSESKGVSTSKLIAEAGKGRQRRSDPDFTRRV